MNDRLLNALLASIPRNAEWQYPPPFSKWDLSWVSSLEIDDLSMPDEWIGQKDIYPPFINLQLSPEWISDFLRSDIDQIAIEDQKVLDWLDAPVYKHEIPEGWEHSKIQKLKVVARRSGLLAMRKPILNAESANVPAILPRSDWSESDHQLWVALINFGLGVKKGRMNGFFRKGLEQMINSWENWFNDQPYLVKDQPERMHLNHGLVRAVWSLVWELIKEWPASPSN